MAVLLILVGLIAAAIAFGVFCLMRSTKDMPTTPADFFCEVKLQLGGLVALTEDMLMRPKNKVALIKKPSHVAVITGGNRGIGLHVIEKLLYCEMNVCVGMRNPENAATTMADVIALSKTHGSLHIEELDVGDMASVRQFAAKVQTKYDKIDLLINNAGVMFVPFKITSDGFESHQAINFLGHFLLTHLLMPQLKRAGTNQQRARVVNVSSCVHKLGDIDYADFHGKKHYYAANAYNQSKLAQVLTSNHLNKLLLTEGAPVQSHSLHPGVVDTDLFENTSTTYIPWFRKLFFKNPEEGSRTVVYACISPVLEGVGGNYLSNCTIASTHSDAQRPEACEKLFNFTCDMLGIRKFGAAS